MTERPNRPRQRNWARLIGRGNGTRPDEPGREGERELLPGIVIRDDGRIGPGSRARHPSTWIELATFALDSARLLKAVAIDRRVPMRAKVVAGLAALYVVSPIDLVPDFIPTAGRIDDIWLIVRSMRYLAESAGYDLLRELWVGSDDGFTLLMGLAGVSR